MTYTVNETYLDNNVMSYSSIMGSTGSQELIAKINAAAGTGTHFDTDDDPFRSDFAYFKEHVVEPIRATSRRVASVAERLIQLDAMRPLVTADDLKAIPPSMHLPIVYFKPIRKMLEEERIDGFGIDAKNLDDEDPYELPCASGYVTFDSETLAKNGGKLTIHRYETSHDPELTHDEIVAIRETREFLNEFVQDDATSHFDPTCYPALHC